MATRSLFRSLLLLAALLAVDPTIAQVKQASEQASVALLERAKAIAAEAEQLADLAADQHRFVAGSSTVDDLETVARQLMQEDTSGGQEIDAALEQARSHSSLLASVAPEALTGASQQASALLASARDVQQACSSASTPTASSEADLDAYLGKAAKIDDDAARNLAVAAENFAHYADYQSSVDRLNALLAKRRARVDRLRNDIPIAADYLQSVTRFNVFQLEQLQKLNKRIEELANLVRSGTAAADPGILAYEAMARDSLRKAEDVIDVARQLIAEQERTVAAVREQLPAIEGSVSPPELPSYQDQQARAESRLGDVRQLTTETRATTQAVRECVASLKTAPGQSNVDAMLESLGVPSSAEPEAPPPVVGASTSGLPPGGFNIEAISFDTVVHTFKGQQYRLIQNVANVHLIAEQGGRQWAVCCAQALQMAMSKGYVGHVPGLGFVSTGKSLPLGSTAGASPDTQPPGGAGAGRSAGSGPAVPAGPAGGAPPTAGRKPPPSSGDTLLGETVHPGAEVRKTAAEVARDRELDDLRRQYEDCQANREAEGDRCSQACGAIDNIDRRGVCITQCVNDWGEFGPAAKNCRKRDSQARDEIYQKYREH